MRLERMLVALGIAAVIAACADDMQPQGSVGTWGGVNFALRSTASTASFSFWSLCGGVSSTTAIIPDAKGHFTMRGRFVQGQSMFADSATIVGTVTADSIDVYLTLPSDPAGSSHHYGGRLDATETTTNFCPG
ncbi:MAG TPA: hypothetical protein VHW65_04040 [Gemmatimonadales bacterium]|jgi:hypothetical protein|nr:hypothetical protein [Gemmatimonadales bacterium]